MANNITAVELDAIAKQVGNAWADKFRGSQALITNASQHIVPMGSKSVTVPIPGERTGAKRIAGGTPAAAGDTVLGSFVMTPNTEYYDGIMIDRLQKVGTEYNLSAFQASSMADAIMASLNQDAWAVITDYNTATGFTNTVGTGGAVPDIKILNAAYTKLGEAKVPGNAQRVAIIGYSEYQEWKDDLTITTAANSLGSGIEATGNLSQALGFNVFADGDRPINLPSTGETTNVAFEPNAIAVAYRNQMPDSVGTVLGQYDDPITGITIFAEVRPHYGVGGVGEKLTVFCVADVALAYEKWVCVIEGDVPA